MCNFRFGTDIQGATKAYYFPCFQQPISAPTASEAQNLNTQDYPVDDSGLILHGVTEGHHDLSTDRSHILDPQNFFMIMNTHECIVYFFSALLEQGKTEAKPVDIFREPLSLFRFYH